MNLINESVDPNCLLIFYFGKLKHKHFLSVKV